MRHAVALYRGMGFTRCPAHDFLASAVLGFDPREGDVLVAAYRLDLRPGRPALARKAR